jgi:predicted enzyme related to lactoylglutathione lyase
MRSAFARMVLGANCAQRQARIPVEHQKEKVMQEVTKYPHATFSWVDLSTTDTEAAKEFYTGLFGWTHEDQPMGNDRYYTMFSLHGKSVCALSSLQPDEKAQGVPPHWNSYITVDNVDEVTQKAAEAGGAVLIPPFDVMEDGRMSVLHDPAGAIFCLWEARNHIGASLVNMPGTLVWNELVAPDTAVAAQFYTTVFGWSTHVDESGEYPYIVFMNGDRAGAGLMQIRPEWGDVPSHWMVYFAVEDCDASADRVKELGGSIENGPIDIPDMGRFALVSDPQGAYFTIIKMNQVDPPPQG